MRALRNAWARFKRAAHGSTGGYTADPGIERDAPAAMRNAIRCYCQRHIIDVRAVDLGPGRFGLRVLHWSPKDDPDLMEFIRDIHRVANRFRPAGVQYVGFTIEPVRG